MAVQLDVDVWGRFVNDQCDRATFEAVVAVSATSALAVVASDTEGWRAGVLWTVTLLNLALTVNRTGKAISCFMAARALNATATASAPSPVASSTASPGTA